MLNHFTIPSKSFNGPVLITGAGGCIGAWTMAMLLKHNIEVIACDLTNNKKRPELLIDSSDLSKVPWIEGDISDTESVLNTVEKYKPESIIHLAALVKYIPLCLPPTQTFLWLSHLKSTGPTFHLSCLRM